jgi:hypothetical protein
MICTNQTSSEGPSWPILTFCNLPGVLSPLVRGWPLVTFKHLIWSIKRLINNSDFDDLALL